VISPENLAIICAGAFFLTGLVTGIWKYLAIKNSADGIAHPYINICHRASLMYAFAAILLAEFAKISQLPEVLEFYAMALVLLYFATAIIMYMLHGIFKDTTNQAKPPFTMGKMPVPSIAITLFMWSLIVAEIGGFLVLFYGVLVALL
jgi:hypothetical protein